MDTSNRRGEVATFSERESDIQRWADAASEGLAALTISTATVHTGPRPARSVLQTSEIPAATGTVAAYPHADEYVDEPTRDPRPPQLRRTRSQRDSLRRRELLLKGKEGSRRRQKWENDRLVGNPWVEPPEPRDWDVRPTYPVHSVPYWLAPLWDERKVRAANKASESKRKAQKAQDPYASVPRELRQRLKRAKGAKGLIQDLEEQVREFVMMWEQKERQLADDGLADVHSSDDEDIVFVGRNGAMQDSTTAKGDGKALRRDKLILESLVDDHGAAFGRWVVHTLASYYNLEAWSVTVGNPARREAYVGLRNSDGRAACGPLDGHHLPQPLWGLV